MNTTTTTNQATVNAALKAAKLPYAWVPHPHQPETVCFLAKANNHKKHLMRLDWPLANLSVEDAVQFAQEADSY
jgi:hypothetical protein